MCIFSSESGRVIDLRGTFFQIFREQSLSIGETGAEGNEQGYETIALAVTGV